MSDSKPVYGPGNPHPLSKMKTELVWEGKYDEFGNRREVDVAGLAMPMQKIETVDQPRSEAAAAGNLELFDEEMKGRRQDDFRNMLIWGDNKLVMASLLKDRLCHNLHCRRTELWYRRAFSLVTFFGPSGNRVGSDSDSTSRQEPLTLVG